MLDISTRTTQPIFNADRIQMEKNSDKKTVFNEKHPVIRLHLWFESDNGVFFGLGRAQLLENIEECGSLKKAAERMGMSYRGAWGKIKKTEEILGIRLIQKLSNKDGYTLTPEGRQFKESFLRWLDEVEGFALQRAEALFPWESKHYAGLAPERES